MNESLDTPDILVLTAPIEDPAVRTRVRELAFRFIGRGEALP